jgi:hypothetical protein
LQAVVQAADESIAHHQAGATLIPQAVREVACEQLRRVDEIGERIEAANQGGNIGFADHHPAEKHELGDRRTDAPKIRAEQAPVERLWHDRASGDSGARHVAPIIRVLSARQELHVGSGTQVINRSRAGQKIGVPELAIGRLANQCTQVKVGLFAAIVESGGAALAVARNPKRAG